MDLATELAVYAVAVYAGIKADKDRVKVCDEFKSAQIHPYGNGPIAVIALICAFAPLGVSEGFRHLPLIACCGALVMVIVVEIDRWRLKRWVRKQRTD